MSSVRDSRQWAAASARTLARRLRRKQQQELGLTRAMALARRVAALRSALKQHWFISDLLGAHNSQLAESLEAARILRALPATDLAEARFVKDLANWARHSPPPGVQAQPHMPAGGLLASRLETFREQLYSDPIDIGQDVGSDSNDDSCSSTVLPPHAVDCCSSASAATGPHPEHVADTSEVHAVATTVSFHDSCATATNWVPDWHGGDESDSTSDEDSGSHGVVGLDCTTAAARQEDCRMCNSMDEHLGNANWAAASEANEPTGTHPDGVSSELPGHTVATKAIEALESLSELGERDIDTLVVTGCEAVEDWIHTEEQFEMLMSYLRQHAIRLAARVADDTPPAMGEGDWNDADLVTPPAKGEGD